MKIPRAAAFSATAATAAVAAVGIAGLCASLTATAARADWLVTRDGARIETKGSWKVDGRRVLFTMPNGTLSTLRTEEIDLDQSALETTRSKEPPVAPAAERPRKPAVIRLTEKDIPPVGALSEEADTAPGTKVEGQQVDTPPLEVISWEKAEDSSGEGLEIFGTMKNGSPNIVATPTVLVAIYDADGGLLASSSGEVNSPQIQPGKTANFRVAFPGVPDFASVKFDAQGRGYKPRIENAAGDDEVEEYEEPSDMDFEAGAEADAEEPPPAE